MSFCAGACIPQMCNLCVYPISAVYIHDHRCVHAPCVYPMCIPHRSRFCAPLQVRAYPKSIHMYTTFVYPICVPHVYTPYEPFLCTTTGARPPLRAYLMCEPHLYTPFVYPNYVPQCIPHMYTPYVYPICVPHVCTPYEPFLSTTTGACIPHMYTPFVYPI